MPSAEKQAELSAQQVANAVIASYHSLVQAAEDGDDLDPNDLAADILKRLEFDRDEIRDTCR